MFLSKLKILNALVKHTSTAGEILAKFSVKEAVTLQECS